MNAPAIANPFRPAEQVAPRVKALLYGAPGVGKTYLALTSPGRIAVIDTEGGTAFYAKRAGTRGLSEFDVLTTKTFAQVEQAIAYIRQNPEAYATVVIDPVTVLYETLQEAAQLKRQETNRRRGRGDVEDADLEMLDWQRIKRSYKRLMTDLVNLPIHVIVVAREKELTEGKGDAKRHVGWGPDAEKSTGYYFDTVLRLIPTAGGREAIVDKDRTGTHPLGGRIASPTFKSLFDKAIKAGKDATAERDLQSDEEAARIDAATTMATAELEEREEELRPIGHITRSGAVAKGDGLRSNLEARMQPDGWLFGFRLELGDGKAIPQVVASGPFGGSLFEQLGKDSFRLHGQRVTVEGELFEVHRPGRRMFHRLMLDRIEGEDWSVPAAPAEAEPNEPNDPEPPAEAATVPLFSDPEEEARVAAAEEAILEAARKSGTAA